MQVSEGSPSTGELPPMTTIKSSIEELQKERAALKQRRALVQKGLKNLKRRNSRLKSRTKLLTSNDLIEVLQMRRDAAAESPKTPGSSSS